MHVFTLSFYRYTVSDEEKWCSNILQVFQVSLVSLVAQLNMLFTTLYCIKEGSDDSIFKKCKDNNQPTLNSA